MNRNFRDTLIAGLWERLARYGRAPSTQRAFIIYELTHALSCKGDY